MRSTQYYHSLRFKTVIKFWVRLSTGADRIKMYKLNITIIGLLNYFLFQIVRKHVNEIKLVIKLLYTTIKLILTVVGLSNLFILKQI